MRFHHDRDPDFESNSRLAPLKHCRRYSDDGVGVFVNLN